MSLEKVAGLCMIQIANLQYKFGAEYQVNKIAWLSKLWGHYSTFLQIQKRRKSIEMRNLVDSRKNWKKQQLMNTHKLRKRVSPQKIDWQMAVLQPFLPIIWPSTLHLSQNWLSFWGAELNWFESYDKQKCKKNQNNHKHYTDCFVSFTKPYKNENWNICVLCHN